ncbi:hypothetical protein CAUPRSCDRAFT_12798, partial [Caulochytrium protostelioides]
ASEDVPADDVGFAADHVPASAVDLAQSLPGDALFQTTEPRAAAALDDLPKLVHQYELANAHLNTTLAEVAAKLQAAEADKQTLMARLHRLEQLPSPLHASASAASQPTHAQLQQALALVAQKETQIQGLLAEGEQLSKTELKHQTIIKKLRAGDAQKTKQLAETSAALQRVQATVDELQHRVAELTAEREQLVKLVRTLRESHTTLQRQATALASERDAQQAAVARLQANEAALQQALQEARDQQQTAAAAAQSAALTREIETNQQLHQTLAE